MGKRRFVFWERFGCSTPSAFILLTMLFAIHSNTYAQKIPADFPQPKHGNTYVIAHRGAHQDAPENSLGAYRKAVELGCDFVEIDVRKTKEGHFVSIHNETVDAYFDHLSGKVNNFTLSELREKPLIKGRGRPSKEYIPTLEEILGFCKDRIGIYLDLKEPDIKNQVRIIKEFGMEHQVIWYIPASFIAVIRQVKMYCDECLVMPDPGPAKNVLKVINSMQPKVLASDMDELTAHFVKQAHQNEVKVFVDDDSSNQEEWRKILEWGTDGIQTDHPAKLIDFIIESED